MKKITLLTILLISLTSVSVSAQNEKTTTNATEVSTLILEQNIVSEIETETINIIEENKVSVITKHKTFKSTSRKARVKNIVNFLKNAELKNDSSVVLC